ncbi:MAG: hypothetical protein IH930_03715 [Proteobacteria bacterium]|nr:hypothetical protein [Pseudomonadota bacterium]
MKSRLMAALAVLLCASMFSVPAAAQDNDRNWENGNVIATTQVFTEPGMFNAYINDLRGLWRVFLDQQIEDGNVVSYRMLVNSFARDGEPDLLLITEHPNWAAFDLSSEYFDELTEKLQGSLAKARDATIERGKLRRLGGNAVYQEIKFKD